MKSSERLVNRFRNCEPLYIWFPAAKTTNAGNIPGKESIIFAIASTVCFSIRTVGSGTSGPMSLAIDEIKRCHV